jgi:hypothetical protein
MFYGGLDNILAALAIAGAFSLIWWVMTLLPLVGMLPLWIIWRLFRFITQRSRRDQMIGGGLTDEWLDGPNKKHGDEIPNLPKSVGYKRTGERSRQ